MPITVLDTDFAQADAVLARSNLAIVRDMIAGSIAAERERCAKIAEGFTPGPTGGAQIAAAIRNKE